MGLLKGLPFILVVALLYSSCSSNAQDHIELVTTRAPRALSWEGCESWRLAVETNNLRDWKNVPLDCKDYMAKYILGGQYNSDSFTVTAAAYAYVQGVQLNNDGKDIWIFDIDDTCLNNTAFYARPDISFGVYSLSNQVIWEDYVLGGTKTANRACLSLYGRLGRLGVKAVFLSGISENYREATERNLKKVGFQTWEKIILRDANGKHMTGEEYKAKQRTELVNMGFRIIGNLGDQWSDISGPNPGLRTFKMPNPMIYTT